MAAVWLTVDQVKDILGEDLTTDLDPESFMAAVDAATGYVEEHRPELAVGDPAAFTPTGHLRYGTALLALRWYSRRRATTDNGDAGGVGDVIADDPDLSRMLGIGVRGAFVFGAPSLPVEAV